MDNIYHAGRMVVIGREIVISALRAMALVAGLGGGDGIANQDSVQMTVNDPYNGIRPGRVVIDSAAWLIFACRP